MHTHKKPMTLSTGNCWLWRIGFSAALAVAYEGVLWRAVERSPLDWLILVVAYGLVGIAALDVLVRYRVRDVIGLMALSACVAPIIALLVSPQHTLVLLPAHLFSRVLGAYGLMTLGVFGLMGFLLSGKSTSIWRLALGYSLGISVLVGVWIPAAHRFAHWGSTPAQPTHVILLYVVTGFSLLLYGFALTHNRARPSVEAFLLSARGWVIVALGLMLILLLQISHDAYTGLDILSVGAMVLLGGLALWYERVDRGKIFMERLLIASPPSIIQLGSVWASVGVGLLLGWQIPPLLDAPIPPVTVLEVGFVLLGFGWMPFLTVWIAARALERESRRLDDSF
jgi:hypothetical protein